MTRRPNGKITQVEKNPNYRETHVTRRVRGKKAN